ncbi:probable carbohydrate esterase At4g34215 [Hibiscus syriacus]|uniref:probable carbohydrate esterase At4g34215 n=1 Tax=Hibiscus syriacus TaxID=106335 RepID=UPI00192374E0|nr:probable carbohydrate esterase At4g34215 [Hibiscus syriacus]
MLSFLLLALVAHATPITCQNILQKRLNILQKRLNIIILAGQSNMAGRGGVANDSATGIPRWDGDIPPQCQPNPSMFKLSANMTWVEAREPIHADIDAKKTNGIGPGMPFANAVLTKDPNIGLVGSVTCAIGGTSISRWQKGEFLYEQLVKRARLALQSGGGYKAMLWYQGEIDTIHKQDVELYGGRLKRFFHDWRSDLQAPMLPIFQVVIASGQGAQIKIGLGNVKSLDAKGLSLEADGLHLTTPAQMLIGSKCYTTSLYSY